MRRATIRKASLLPSSSLPHRLRSRGLTGRVWEGGFPSVDSIPASQEGPGSGGEELTLTRVGQCQHALDSCRERGRSARSQTS